MDDINNGKVVDFDDIDNYDEAIKSFAEGSESLEKLLTTYFSNGVKTLACCRGHQDIEQKPYISFEYSDDNKSYLDFLLVKHKDNISYSYSKKENQKSFLSVSSNEYSQELFEKLEKDFLEYNSLIDYHEQLSSVHKRYSNLIEVTEKNKEINPEYLTISYYKNEDNHNINVTTLDSVYNYITLSSGFIKDNNSLLYSSNLNSSDEELICRNMNKLIEEAKLEIDINEKDKVIKTINSNKYLEENFKKLGLEFEYNQELYKKGIMELKVDLGTPIDNVIDKLSALNELGIDAVAVFNDIVISNQIDGLEGDVDIRQEIKRNYNSGVEEVKSTLDKPSIEDKLTKLNSMFDDTSNNANIELNKPIDKQSKTLLDNDKQTQLNSMFGDTSNNSYMELNKPIVVSGKSSK